jgi:hemolysin III
MVRVPFVAAISRNQTRAELAADGAVHAVGLIGAVAGAVALIGFAIYRGSAPAIAAVSIYAATLVLMLLCSALYNIARKSRRRELFRRLDHAGIFAMIAGTYTPFTTLFLEGAWSIAMTASVWLVAGLGIALKLWRPDRLERFSTAMYLAMGWIGIVAFKPLQNTMELPVLVLIAAGGALYTIGVLFHHWERLPFQNAIWHGFVVSAAGVHYGAIFYSIV